ncbi:hypothetical protein N0B51_08615 [Tsuneonella sp. YG55]|uniref:Uncharacterized protein n=1 Tax=Tsuneonella litorea TaxID=2976475 RepID=A0A9X2W1J4_9SPHN|nr:hypothetical protein [Tsuneonella litorea]MCT2559042.1 hypothetical protein [Tsuneonella litorea]
MNKLILAGAAALAFAIPAGAQDMAVTSDGEVYVMTDAQQTAYDAWPPERQTLYTGWPNTYQTYFWTLSPAQQDGWWVLTDDQRAKVYAMAPQQRVAAWNSIVAQMNGGPAPAASATAQAATTAAASASTAGPRFVSNAVVQTTPGDAGPPTGDVPICKPNQQDNCINAWEAGKRGPGVTRPLAHWPGKPASEM